MGLFNFGKKKQEEELRQQLKQKYRAMSLKELTSAVDTLWKIESKIEKDAICSAYAMALFKTDKSEGGFGIPVERLVPVSEFESYNMVKFVKEYGLAYRYDENGEIVSINKALVFMGNYMHVDKEIDLGRVLSIAEIMFVALEDNAFSDEDILDEYFQLYNPWLNEESVDPNDSRYEFTKYKIQVIATINNPETCEEYGAFKRKNGVVTSEYITVDDLVEAKSYKQLANLLDYYQTRH